MMPDGRPLLPHTTYSVPANMAALGLARKQSKNLQTTGGKQQQQQQQQQNNKKSIKERWVMLNKERFHEIFNETLLHEMTVPEQALPDVVRVSPEMARVSPEVSCVSPKVTSASSETARISPEVVRVSPEVATVSPDVACASPGAASTSTQVTLTSAKGDKPDMTHIPCEMGSVPPEVMPLNLVVSDSARASDRHRKVTARLPSPPRERIEKNNRQKNREKIEKKVNRSESKTRSCPADEDKATTDRVESEDIARATTKSSVVFSELLKNRPLVSAALFGKQSSGSECSGSEIIPVAPGKAGQEEDTVIDPVGSPSDQPSMPTGRVITPSSSERSHPYTPWEERTACTKQQESTGPPPSAAACVGCETPAAANSACHSQHSGRAKNSSSVSECTLSPQSVPQPERNVPGALAECSKHRDTDMNSRTMEVQRQNWVTLSKSTVYNLVDELVGSRLGSSGEEEEEETKDRSPPPRRSITSQPRTSYKDTTPPRGAKVHNPLLKRPPAAPSAAASIPSANKQVLKQCWVALNKTVVFDMVEQAMAGEKEAEVDPSPPKLKPAYCDRDCSENYIDSACAIHKQVTNTKSEARKRAVEDSESKGSRKRKRVAGRAVGCPQRPASAPVERSSPQHSPKLQRAPSPHSKEYHVLQQEHASQCDKLLAEARHRVSVEAAAATSLPPVPQGSTTMDSAPMDSASRESPKLGWVAVSKAEVHTIVDSVMSSLLQQEVNEGSDKAALERGSTPPPVLRQQVPAPVHRPWLVSSSSSSSSLKQASSQEPCADSASSPSAGSSASSTASSPSHDTHSRAPFKWKSSLLLRVSEECNNSPPPGDTMEPDADHSEDQAPLDMSSKTTSNDSSTRTSSSSTSSPSTSSQRRKSRAHKTK